VVNKNRDTRAHAEGFIKWATRFVIVLIVHSRQDYAARYRIFSAHAKRHKKKGWERLGREPLPKRFNGGLSNREADKECEEQTTENEIRLKLFFFH